MNDRLDLQSNEFNSLVSLWRKFEALPSVVDDDYPEARHYYESALKSFLQSCKSNGRNMS